MSSSRMAVAGGIPLSSPLHLVRPTPQLLAYPRSRRAHTAAPASASVTQVDVSSPLQSRPNSLRRAIRRFLDWPLSDVMEEMAIEPAAAAKQSGQEPEVNSATDTGAVASGDESQEKTAGPHTARKLLRSTDESRLASVTGEPIGARSRRGRRGPTMDPGCISWPVPRTVRFAEQARPTIQSRSLSTSSIPNKDAESLRQAILRQALTLVTQHSFTRNTLLIALSTLPSPPLGQTSIPLDTVHKPEAVIDTLFGSGTAAERVLVKEWESEGLRLIRETFVEVEEMEAQGELASRARRRDVPMGLEARLDRIERGLIARLAYSASSASEHLVQAYAILALPSYSSGIPAIKIPSILRKVAGSIEALVKLPERYNPPGAIRPGVTGQQFLNESSDLTSSRIGKDFISIPMVNPLSIMQYGFRLADEILVSGQCEEEGGGTDWYARRLNLALIYLRAEARLLQSGPTQTPSVIASRASLALWNRGRPADIVSQYSQRTRGIHTSARSTVQAARTEQYALKSTKRLFSTGPVVAPVPNRGVLEVTGPEAQKFLKGLTSRDVEALGGGYSGIFNASGRVLHDIFIYPRITTSASSATSTSASGSSYLIDFPSSRSTSVSANVPDLTQYLRKFILRSKVRIRDVSAEWNVWNSWGSADIGQAPSLAWKFGSGGSAEPAWDLSGKTTELRRDLAEEEVACWDLRAGWGAEGMGRRILSRNGNRPAALVTHDEARFTDYALRRMLLGVPEGSEEIIPGAALPLESCMDVMGGIDFRKGCYVGQELTVRTYHTGHTRKRIMPLRFSPHSTEGLPSVRSTDDPTKWSETVSPAGVLGIEPKAGDPITYFPPSSSASQKPKTGVKVLSVHPEFAVGLGLVRLELPERVFGSLAEFGQPSSTAMEGQRGMLMAGADMGGWMVWAGKGRGWYTA